MATIKRAITLKHRANVEDEGREIPFQEGEEITVLKEWDERVLCKNATGLLFNVPKEHVEL